MGSREQLAQAVADGTAAGLRGDRVTACPHGRDTLLRTAWIRGYARARPLPRVQGDNA